MRVQQKFNWMRNCLEVDITEIEGVCCKQITVELVPWFETWKIKTVIFDKGCNGQGKAVSRLLCGVDLGEAIERLSGIQCGKKATSCSDQLSKGLSEVTKSPQEFTRIGVKKYNETDFNSGDNTQQ